VSRDVETKLCALANALADEVLSEGAPDPTQATTERLATVYIRLGKLVHEKVQDGQPLTS